MPDWISVIMNGESLNIDKDEDLILLPCEPKIIEDFEREHPDAEIFDLSESKNFFKQSFERLHCDIFDILSQDCELKTLNNYLNKLLMMDEEEFEDTVLDILKAKEECGGMTTWMMEKVISSQRLSSEMLDKKVKQMLFDYVLSNEFADSFKKDFEKYGEKSSVLLLVKNILLSQEEKILNKVLIENNKKLDEQKIN